MTTAGLAAMDARLDKGQDWLRDEYRWLQKEHAANRHAEPEWEKRAAGWVKQQCRWDALFAEYVQARDTLSDVKTTAAQTEAERQWAALA